MTVLQRLRLAIKRQTLGRCEAFVHRASRDLDWAQERLAAEESAAFLSASAPTAISYRTKFDLLKAAVTSVSIDGLFCEFGVYRGKTINYIASLTPGAVHGFDSFEGLPEDWRAGHEKGVFSCERLPDVSANVVLHKGWFNESLPPFLAEHAGKVAFLHVDCDLYSSTRVVLDLLSDRITAGTVIQFDEFLNFPSWRHGEFKAFNEFSAANVLDVEFLGYVRRDEQLALRVKSIRNQ